MLLLHPPGHIPLLRLMFGARRSIMCGVARAGSLAGGASVSGVEGVVISEPRAAMGVSTPSPQKPPASFLALTRMASHATSAHAALHHLHPFNEASVMTITVVKDPSPSPWPPTPTFTCQS